MWKVKLDYEEIEPTFNSKGSATTSMKFVFEEGPIDELQDSTTSADEISFDNPQGLQKYYKWRSDSHNHDATTHYPPGGGKWHHSSTPYPEGRGYTD